MSTEDGAEIEIVQTDMECIVAESSEENGDMLTLSENGDGTVSVALESSSEEESEEGTSPEEEQQEEEPSQENKPVVISFSKAETKEENKPVEISFSTVNSSEDGSSEETEESSEEGSGIQIIEFQEQEEEETSEESSGIQIIEFQEQEEEGDTEPVEFQESGKSANNYVETLATPKPVKNIAYLNECPADTGQGQSNNDVDYVTSCEKNRFFTEKRG